MQLELNADFYGADDAISAIADSAQEATVRININEDGDLPEFTCASCGEHGEEYPDGVQSLNGAEHNRCDARECEQCDGVGAVGDNSDACDACDSTGQDGHDWQRTPLSWCNSARIATDPQEDQVTLSISTGDPRGCFALTVWRTEDGRLLMRVPHPSDLLLHEPLTPLQALPGTYRIGHYGPAGPA